MGLRLTLLLLLLSQRVHAYPFKKFFKTDSYEIEKIIHHDVYQKKNVVEVNLNNLKVIDETLKDPKKRISDQFVAPDFFYPNIKFWLIAYGFINSHEIIIHDKDNVGEIYRIVSFEKIYEKSKNEFIASHFQTSLGVEKSFDIKKSLKGSNKSDIDKSNRVRIQTGQKNKVERNFKNYLKYKDFISYYLNEFRMPKELAALPMLESGYNVEAVSKVGASGIWQIMPFIAGKIMVKNRRVDDRRNPLLSSIAALHLLQQNYKIMKRWDLAITAYNSGTKHLIKARRELKKAAPSLSEVFKSYESKHHGFASKNFFSGFIALAHLLNYPEVFFKDLKTKSRSYNPKKIHFYLTKCSFNFRKFRNTLRKEFSRNTFLK